MKATALLSSLLAPPQCAACGRVCAPSGVICAGCRAQTRPAGPCSPPAGLDGCWACVSYDGPARALVAALKFRALVPAAAAMAAWIAAAAPAPRLRGTLVPVPAAPARLRRRGFDPAAVLAAGLARECGLPLGACLARADGPRQVGRERRRRLVDPPRVWCRSPAPRECLLVDDVQTTGATLAACASALRAAGAARVAAVTFARAP